MARTTHAPAERTPLLERTVSPRTLLWIAIGLYVAFSAVRIAFALFPKTIDVMPDELRYLDLARSLFSDGTLTIRGDETTFQKILYPLALFPAMLFQDSVSQVKAIGVLSSLYVCSAVFPTYLFARRVFGTRLVATITALVLVLIMPDMAYSMTFMSESLFFPLALWLAYLMWRTLCNTSRRYPELCLASGCACYAVYLCKEVAAAYAIAFCAMLVILALRGSRTPQDAVMGIACFLVGFLAPFVVLKATLFSGMGNSYNQTDPNILLSLYTWAFALYAFVTDFTYLVVGFGFFCLAFPLLGWRRFTSEQKRLLAFSLLAIGVGLLTVVYTISIREDVGHVALRQHLRYVIPLFIPLMMLFMEQVRTQDFRTWRTSPRMAALLTGTVVAACLLCATMFGSANLSQGFDNSQFHMLRDFLQQFQPLAQQSYDITARTLSNIDDSETLLTINPGVWIARAVVIAFILAGTIGLISRHKRAAYLGIMVVLCAACIGNNIGAVKYNWKAYEISEDQITEAVQLDDYLNALPDGTKVLIVNDTNRTQLNNISDTYIQDRRGLFRYVSDTTFAQDADHGILNQAAVMGMAGLAGDEEYQDTSLMTKSLSHIDYILVGNDQKITFQSSNVVDTGVGEHLNFTLYKVTNSDSIRVQATAPATD